MCITSSIPSCNILQNSIYFVNRAKKKQQAKDDIMSFSTLYYSDPYTVFSVTDGYYVT